MVSPHTRKKNKRRRSKRSSRKGRVRRLTAVLFRLTLGWLLISFLLVLTLRWLNPPVSMMMILQRYDSAVSHRKDFRIDYRWVNWEQIAVHLPLAMIAAEDQKFTIHHGFDFKSIADAVETRMNGGRLRGASTISQQVAKNLFLWPGKSLLRKGIEAYFTTLIEMLWSKQRILEVYMNIVELGDGVYGVEAASRRFFKKPAGRIGLGEAVRLAAVLPNPKAMSPDHPSPHVSKRARWIRRQIDRMGGKRVLNKIETTRVH
jgi:monofunctional biosynthetic peptidoglycan transglycosylase